MKNAFLLTLTMFLTGILSAQKSNLIFFTENGEKFTVIMNGLRYNEVPTTNVKLTDLTAPSRYKVKILFEDPTLGELNETINLDVYQERTFNIRLRRETAVGNGLKKASNQVARDFAGRDSNDIKKKEAEKDKYVMRLVSETPLAMPMPPAPPVQQTTVVTQQPVYAPAPTGAVTQTTTTRTTTVQQPATTTTTVVAPAAGMNVSVNDPDMGVNFNMSVGVPVGGAVVTSGGTVQQTTTTVTTSGELQFNNNLRHT